MKALWFVKTMSSNREANLFVGIFVTNFAKLWIRLIDLKFLA
jgi:hypothetical protein